MVLDRAIPIYHSGVGERGRDRENLTREIMKHYFLSPRNSEFESESQQVVKDSLW